MFRNYFKITIRSLWRNKTFSLINILGLTVGTACFLYIFLLIQHHKNFDKQHAEASDLYRLTSDLELGSSAETLHMATCSPPIVPALHSEFPEVVLFSRACAHPGLEQNLLRVDDKVFYEKKGLYVDSTFFRMFNYHFNEGNAESALDQPNTLVLSEALATKLFAHSSPMGQTVYVGGDGAESPLKVTGVFNDQLGASHLMPTFFMSMNSNGIGQYIRSSNSWAGNNFIYGYIKLQPGADPHALEAKLPEFLLAHGADQLRELGMRKELHLQPVSAIHTNTQLSGDVASNISGSFLTILLIIASFIQLVACINFMNLTTARSSKRAQEVGIRKTIGAPRSSLVIQFIGESLLIATVAMLLAIPLLHYLLPFLNEVVNTHLSFDLWTNQTMLLMVFLIIFVTGVIAGSYPALYLSSFKPITIIRAKQGISGNTGTGLLRKGLVIGQFAVAIILVIGALIIRSQLSFMQQKDLGFEKDQKIVFAFPSQEAKSKLDIFRTELLQNSQVQGASAMSQTPGQIILQDIPLYKEGEDMNSAIDVRVVYADEDYFKTLKVDLISGRSLTMADTVTIAQQVRVILNETAVKQFGLNIIEAPGQNLFCEFEGNNIRAQVVGVMQDIIYEDLAAAVRPFMIVAEPRQNLSFLVADVQSDNHAHFLQEAEKSWHTILPEIPFDYSFLDTTIDAQYRTEQSLSRIISIFTYLAIFISCLGLFGLSVFAAENRMKEIGIRKILGASELGIVALLSKDFLKLVVVSLVVASPIAYFLMQRWLANFAHHTEVSWKTFAIAGSLALLLALLTISFQSLRAALHNPIASLRDE